MFVTFFRPIALGESQSIDQEKTDVASSHITYSHDLVNMDLTDVLVDEDGIVDNERFWASTG